MPTTLYNKTINLSDLVNSIKKIEKIKTPEISEIWISTEKVDLFSGDKDFWILLVGGNELDLPFNMNNRLSACLSYWRKQIQYLFQSENELDDNVSIIVCSKKRAKRLQSECIYSANFYRLEL
jgi:hypothetical protein